MQIIVDANTRQSLPRALTIASQLWSNVIWPLSLWMAEGWEVRRWEKPPSRIAILSPEKPQGDWKVSIILIALGVVIKVSHINYEWSDKMQHTGVDVTSLSGPWPWGPGSLSHICPSAEHLAEELWAATVGPVLSLPVVRPSYDLVSPISQFLISSHSSVPVRDQFLNSIQHSLDTGTGVGTCTNLKMECVTIEDVILLSPDVWCLFLHNSDSEAGAGPRPWCVKLLWPGQTNLDC